MAQYDVLTSSWRVAYGIIGAVLLVVGVFGTAAEVYLAMQGYVLAWLAAVMTACFGVLGAYLLHAVRQGRIRTLGIGRKPPAV